VSSHLTTLKIMHLSLTATALQAISALQQLQVLEAKFCSIPVDVAHNGISPSGFVVYPRLIP
jgi:hypothetical protein